MNKRYLAVLHYPTFGGPHNHAVRLASPLRERGWDTVVVLPSESGNALPRFQDAGIRVIQLPLHRLRASASPRLLLQLLWNLRSEVKTLRRLITDEGIDMVVIGGLVNPHGAFAARGADVPIVWKIVDSRSPKPLRAVLMPLVEALADTVMFDGEALKRLHVSKGRDLRVPSVIYNPPVATRRFVPSGSRRREVRRQLGIPDAAPVVGTVANLNPQKGIEYFIRAASLIQKAIPSTYFVVVGAKHATHQAYEEKLALELAKGRFGQGTFIYAGDRQDVENYYPVMDVKLITSVPRSEGTTTTALEAMSCGVPVVASDVGAVREVVEHERTGLVVPPCNPVAFADAVCRLLSDHTLRSRFGGAARARVTVHHDIDRAADAQVQVFGTAIGHHSESRSSPRG